MTEIRIHPNIFEGFPTFRRGIVIAKNLDNQGHAAELEDRLQRLAARGARAHRRLLPRHLPPGRAGGDRVSLADHRLSG